MVFDDDTGNRPYRPISSNDRPIMPIEQVSEATQQVILRVAAEHREQGPKWILHKIRETRHDISEDEVRSVLYHRLRPADVPGGIHG